jgi:hypothetical protein
MEAKESMGLVAEAQTAMQKAIAACYEVKTPELQRLFLEAMAGEMERCLAMMEPEVVAASLGLKEVVNE